MKVRAIETSDPNGITRGKIYEVSDSDYDTVVIINDEGIDKCLYKYHFEEVEDEVNYVDPTPVQSSIPERCELKTYNPLNIQVGGNYYKKLKIQPMEYAHANKLDFFQGSVLKYITRFRDKNGKQDLEKAKHFIDLLIKLEYGEDDY